MQRSRRNSLHLFGPPHLVQADRESVFHQLNRAPPPTDILSFHALDEFSRSARYDSPTRAGSPDGRGRSPGPIRSNRHTTSLFRQMPPLSESSEMIRDISPLSKVRECPRDTSVSSGDRSDQQVGTTEPSTVLISGHPSYGAIESSPPDSPESPIWSTELDWVFVSFVFLVFGSQVSCCMGAGLG